jgi:hypothetical protein
MESSIFNLKNNYPRSIVFNNTDSVQKKEINLIIHGQGVFIFENTDNNQLCSFRILNNDKSDGYVVNFLKKGILIDRVGMDDPLMDKDNTVGLTDMKGSYYWISLDSQNQRIICGIGEARMETKTYIYEFIFTNDDDRKKNKKFLESLVTINISNDSVALKNIKLIRDPITSNVPLIIKNTHELTMDHIAESKYLPNANLSLVSQILYDCISGKHFVLNDKDFPQFSDAIEHSIKTEGCWCNTRLKQKENEFSKDKPNVLETYLRITLGENNGESTGIPYVMEIWPIGHYSPIHSHGNANAVIRVLNGTINVNLYGYLNNDLKPFANTNFVKDEITWISSNLNQIHKLENLGTSKETCITIQCYIYNKNDGAHYDYFDYIDDNGDLKQYEPDSDMDFVQFKKLIKKEWLEMKAMKAATKCCSFL